MPVGYLAPEIALVLGAVACLLVALVSSREHQAGAVLPALAAPVASAGLAVLIAVTTDPIVTFHATWALDDVTLVARLLVAGVTAVTIVLSPEWLRGDQRHAEWYAMLLFGATGASLMAGAADVMQLLVGVLLSSVSTYVLVAYHRRSAASVEAGIKTFLLGSLANVLLLVGAVLFLGLAGGTGYGAARATLADADPTLLLLTTALVVVGLAFKAGLVPIHAWLPDAAQGAPGPAAAFVTVAPKVGALVGLLRFVSVLPDDQLAWRGLLAVMAAVTMTVGNLGALWQDDVRRLLGWSSVSQSGYALMALTVVGREELAVGALLLFLVAYAVAQLAAFGVVVELRGRTRLEDYAGLLAQRPWLAVVMTVALLSFVGIPPTAGFAGKLVLFGATIDGGFAWLAVVAVLNSALSLFYYLRVVAPMTLSPAPAPVAVLGRWAASGTVIAAVATLAVGLAAEVVLGVLRGAPPLPGPP